MSNYPDTDVLETVDLSEDIRVEQVEITETVEMECSVSGEPFRTDISIFYEPDGEVLELVSVREWLSEFEIGTCEDAAHATKIGLEAVLDGIVVDVKAESQSDIHPPTTVVTGGVYSRER